jgi:hypothetical protein
MEISAAALCTTDGFARVVARNSVWMRIRNGYIVLARDVRMLLAVIESDEVSVSGVICLCRYSKVYCQSLKSTYLARYSQMPYLTMIGSHRQYSARAYVPGSRTDSWRGCKDRGGV